MNDFVTAWETLFGVYSPIQVVDQITGEVSVMTDWGYVTRCAFFIIVVYCILKLIGGVLKSDSKR